jgi:uncharacterized membrane protein
MNLLDDSFGPGWKHDLAMVIVMTLGWIMVYSLYQAAPMLAIVLVLGIPTVIVYSRWLNYKIIIEDRRSIEDRNE